VVVLARLIFSRFVDLLTLLEGGVVGFELEFDGGRKGKKLFHEVPGFISTWSSKQRP
jgi:hypothetical protein